MGQLVGVVLAGGTGDRIGQPKGHVAVEGVTLAERAAGILWPLCGSVLISLAGAAANPAPEFPPVFDPPPPGRGPLVGIDAAFRATGDADLVVLACDYPYVTQTLLRRLVSHAIDDDDLVIMTDLTGRDHPLVALWKRRAASTVRAALDEGRYKVRSLLGDLSVRRLGPGEFRGVDLQRVLVNVNGPDELAALLGEGR